MFRTKPGKTKDPFSRLILWSIPAIALPAGVMHFLYELSGNMAAVGLFAPVNESVWEHQKLAFVPMLLWWILSFIVLRKRPGMSALRWFFSGAVAELVCPLFIISFFYIHTGALGLHSLLLDVSSLFIGVILAQTGGLHAYRYSRLSPIWVFVIFLMTALLFLAYIVFTFAPPHLPLFMDSLTGSYGM
ncbi:MAG: hypothetical protein H6Q58_102 [Firmicutes bacterium]|nr:hypothetical protein [Bacillota bacterium]